MKASLKTAYLNPSETTIFIFSDEVTCWYDSNDNKPKVCRKCYTAECKTLDLVMPETKMIYSPFGSEWLVKHLFQLGNDCNSPIKLLLSDRWSAM